MRVGLLILLGLASWVGLHSALTVWLGVKAQPRQADVAIVLGNRVERSGVPSIHLRVRLDRALELYQNGTVRYIIVSGGLGREGFQEADVMREYLAQRGVPTEKIFTDRAGYDTYESGRSAKMIMDAQGFHSAVIVSHYFHLHRALLAFYRFGISEVSAAAVDRRPAWRDTYSVLREFAAFYFYLFRNYATT
ncbi:MAG: hypothetical protein HDKAJFGB_01126 [Anaerolineae bacterium]|nr:hypothetical protein [Anaerolineae bacterium]